MKTPEEIKLRKAEYARKYYLEHKEELIRKNKELRHSRTVKPYESPEARERRRLKDNERSRRRTDENPEQTRLKARERHIRNREIENERNRICAHKFPLKSRAKEAVAYALRSGKLKKPESCEHCGAIERLDGHHWSYEEKHRLSVYWLCRPCHHRVHSGLITLPKMEGSHQLELPIQSKLKLKP